MDTRSRADHRPLLSDQDFLNAVVEKLWVEDSVLLEYAVLEVRVAELLESLERELGR